jgi:hypothetical protein
MSELVSFSCDQISHLPAILQLSGEPGYYNRMIFVINNLSFVFQLFVVVSKLVKSYRYFFVVPLDI